MQRTALSMLPNKSKALSPSPLSRTRLRAQPHGCPPSRLQVSNLPSIPLFSISSNPVFQAQYQGPVPGWSQVGAPGIPHDPYSPQAPPRPLSASLLAPDGQVHAPFHYPSTSDLFLINRRLFGCANSAMLDTPVTVLASVLQVKLVDPEFHEFFKKPHTAGQALAVIEKASEAAITAFSDGMKKSGKAIIPVMEA